MSNVSQIHVSYNSDIKGVPFFKYDIFFKALKFMLNLRKAHSLFNELHTITRKRVNNLIYIFGRQHI